MPIASRKTTQEMPDATAAGGEAAAALLDRLAVLGVSIRSDGGALRLAPLSLLPADLLAEVRAHKAALIALLTAPVVAAVVASSSPPPLGLFPADRGYHARQPVQAAPAIATNPDVADGHIAAMAAAVATLRADPADMTGVLPHWPPGSWRKRRYASDTPGALWTTLQRPVSWADPAARPTLGDWCGCCEGARWWRDSRRQDGGWLCWACHPPSGLAASDIEEVRT